MILGSAVPANAQVSIDIGIGTPNTNIGTRFPTYPDLERVTGYPVYYAPRANTNLFFYDGLYWAYDRDDWYASSWYNGPWSRVQPRYVPSYILRVPVGYYRSPPPYFRGWPKNSPPRWGQHYGRDWEQERHGWDNWDHRSSPPPAPLPVYQRQYSGNRYPSVQQQLRIHDQYYQYHPSEPVVRQHYEQQGYGKQKPKQPGQSGAAHGQSQGQGANAQGGSPQGKGASKDSKGGKEKDDDGKENGQGPPH
jgi:hypothetical protein